MKLINRTMMLTLLLTSLVTLSVPLAMAASNNETWYNDGGYTNKLVAGKNTVVGSISISKTDSSITITLTTIGDWLLVETHIHVAGSLAEIPQTGSGNPKPGHFDDNQEHDPAVSTYSNDFDVSGMTTAYIAIHAVVQGCSGRPTAWGGWCQAWTMPFEGSNWAVYIAAPISQLPTTS